ncbi:putative F-box/kelch-repeat protein [Raphanus sativus]|nr:putative F-box/kelch-repeat protein [Raphanus sativus]
MVESSLIPGLVDNVAELCLSRVPRSSFQIISQVCWRWRRFLRSEHYAGRSKVDGIGRGVNVRSGLVVSDGGKIVFIGGRYNKTASADVYEFNPATNRWRKLADMNLPRYNFAYAEVEGLLYVIRGYSTDDVSILNAEVYNPKTNQWSLMDCPQRPNFSPAFAFSFNSKLFIVGNRSRFIDIYDPRKKTWEELDSGQTLDVYSYTVVRNKVYFFDHNKPGLGVFDPEKNSWSSVLDVPSRNEHGLRFCLGQWNNKVTLFPMGSEALSGDLVEEDASRWRATPIILSGYHATSVLINF